MATPPVGTLFPYDLTKDVNMWAALACNEIFAETRTRTIMTPFTTISLGKAAIDAQATPTTIAPFPSGIFNESYVSDNLITQVVSSSAADTQLVRVSGSRQTPEGDWVFSQEEFNLTGQTPVTLSTPLIRVNFLENQDSTDLAGDISVFRDGTATGGVPDDPAEVHLLNPAGDNRSHKGAFSIPSNYWGFLVSMGCAIGEGNSGANAAIELQVREFGGVFKEQWGTVLRPQGGAVLPPSEIQPFIRLPPKSDVRAVAITDGNSAGTLRVDMGFALARVIEE